VADRAETLVRDGEPTFDADSARAGSLPRPAIHVAGTARPPVSKRVRLPANGQLALPLAALPTLAMEVDWKAQPRLWGHAYHPMCSYLASFPAALAHAFVARYTRPGDVVLDPFAGRGTTPLQACAEGRIGVGNDLNPLAHVLTSAKVEPPAGREVEARLASLRIEWSLENPAWLELAGRVVAGAPALVPSAGSGGGPGDAGETVPAEVALAFHRRTLAQVLFARARLQLGHPADRFLAAALVGILHGKRPGYLSELMPNTFSMAPRYVRDFAARRAAHPSISSSSSARSCAGSRATGARRRPGSRCSGTRATLVRALAPPFATGRSPTGHGSSSPRRPTCGSSSTGTTAGSGPGSWASRPPRSTPPSMTPIAASRTSSSCGRCWRACAQPSPTMPSWPWFSVTSRQSGAGRRPTGCRSASPTRPG
jgi:hypothetical protein